MGPRDLIKSRGILSRLKATSVMCQHVHDFARISVFATLENIGKFIEFRDNKQVFICGEM